MKRRRSSYLSGLFFNTGNYNERTVDQSFAYTRQFADVTNERLLDDERIENKRKQEEQLKKDEPTNKPNDSQADLPKEE